MRKLRSARRLLRLELLEPRRVMCAELPAEFDADIDFDRSTGELTIIGTHGDDVAEVFVQGKEVVARLEWKDASGNVRTRDRDFDVDQVTKIIFYGGDGNDIFVNDTPTESFACGGAGDDSLTGGEGHDELHGADGWDWLDGRGGDDELYGGNHSDWLRGGAGDDRLEGGNGSDEYLFNHTGHLGTDELIDASTTGPGKLNFNGRNEGVRVDLNSTAAQTVDASGEITIILSSADGFRSIIGTHFDDQLIGNRLDNYLLGLWGDDYLEGDRGMDQLIGDYGNDILRGDEGSDYLSGGEDDDRYVFAYGGLGRDTVDEAANQDRDTLDFRLFTDQVNIDLSSTAMQSMNFQLSLILTSGMGIEDVLAPNSNNIVRDHVLLGNNRDNYLQGGYGNDLLNGRGGNDTLNGHYGNDVLEGGAGNDALEGGMGDDTFLYNGLLLGADTITDQGGVREVLDFDGFLAAVDVDLSQQGMQTVARAFLSLNIEGGTIDVLRGTRFNDQLHGDDRANEIYGLNGDDTIHGAGDNDVIRGGWGVDTLYGDAGDDTLLGENGNDTLDGGADNDELDGGAGDDHLFGGSENDELDGGAGSDELIGGLGDDKLIGGAGDDTLEGNGGSDSYLFIGAGLGRDQLNERGGDGKLDVLDFSRFSYGIDVDLEETSAQRIHYSALTLTIAGDIEDVIGTNFDDYIHGNGLDNRLFGGAGDDEIRGCLGDDYIQGDAGDDVLYGGANNDVVFGGIGNDDFYDGSGTDYLYGESGNDRLFGKRGDRRRDYFFGGAGDDYLSGGDGDDRLTGGAGADKFDLDYGYGTVMDKESEDDVEGESVYPFEFNPERPNYDC